MLKVLISCSVFGRILPGAAGDRYGRFNVMIVMSYMGGILALALWIPAKSNAPIIVFASLYGFASGAFVSMAPALVAQISDIREIGTRNGSLFAAISIASLIGAPIGGALVTDNGTNFLHLQIFCGVCLLAGSTFFLLARIKLGGFALMKKV